MKQQVTPAIVAGAVVAALVLIGLVVYFMNRPAAPTAPPAVPGASSAARNLSPDQQVKMRMQQMQQGRLGGQ